ncbi:gamma-glutamylcyclotransferase family protein, partial [Aspergillus aculeatinus CBS 121060]
PPPPPPPPPPSNPKSKISPHVLRLRTTSPRFINHAPKAQPVAAPTGPYIFYGTLADPSILGEVLGVAEKPQLKPAFLLGYACKLWGQYPALVEAEPGSVVRGVVYQVRTREDGERLAVYETENYRAERCRIRIVDGEGSQEVLGYTFKFVGVAEDLSEGSFDLEVWLRRMGRRVGGDKVDSA